MFDIFCIVSLISSESDGFMVHVSIISVRSMCSRSAALSKYWKKHIASTHILLSVKFWEYGSPINTGNLRHGKDAFKTVRNVKMSYENSCCHLWNKLCV